MKMTPEECEILSKAIEIFHDSGMTEKETYLLFMALVGPENVGRLYEKLEKCPERNKRAMYMNTLEVLKNLDDGYLTRHRYVEED